jgi:hypothetical protein
MPTAPAVPQILPSRRLVGLIVALVALIALAVPALAGAAPPRPHATALPKPAVLTFKTATVGSPGNPSVAIIPFTSALYANCASAPQEPKLGKSKLPDPCQEVGSVPYEYGIGKVEVTVEQYVAFLNTVDPFGRNQMGLYSENESGTAWPRFGQIDYSALSRAGQHYTAAAPEWNDKPYGFANFLRSARFDNSVANGKVLSKTESTSGSGNEEFKYVTYKVQLSRRTATGMYDMHTRAPVRTKESGFVIPSQNEWIKAAYYDRTGGGTYSYWWYPTNDGSPFFEGGSPSPVTLDPATGDVTNANGQSLANFHAEGQEAAYWCPSNQTQEACETVNPLHLPAKAYKKLYQGSLNTVGEAGTFSPWGTLEQGGNAVEWTDTITAPPFGAKGHRVWRRLHGGVPNAPLYQLWVSAVGLQPQKNTFYTATYPWIGFRIGVIGALSHGANR